MLTAQTLTGTMKIRKTEIQKAAYQPTSGADDVLIADPSSRSYRPITPDDLEGLKNGHIPGTNRKAKIGEDA